MNGGLVEGCACVCLCVGYGRLRTRAVAANLGEPPGGASVTGWAPSRSWCPPPQYSVSLTPRRL